MLKAAARRRMLARIVAVFSLGGGVYRGFVGDVGGVDLANLLCEGVLLE